MTTPGKNEKDNGRRGFLGSLATGAAVLGLSTIASPLSLKAGDIPLPNFESNTNMDPDEWFNKVSGKHRVVFDAPRPHEIMPFAWPRVFLLTNMATGSTEKDCGVVVVLRHDAIPYAMEDSLWAKYKFGEVFKADDPETGKPSLRNPFWKPKEGAFKIPGFGTVSIGINELQASGVMFCVCDAAMTVYSAALASGAGKSAAEVKKEWVDGILPGIQAVPSGVWALGRAQEKKCAYIYAG
ncbi:MAG: hypothetical protein GC171_01700 [Terrimonas sp.]|nr:hypothetical protein [Terrimonas sp.]